MIDYQPSHGMHHCHCSDVRDGFTFSTTAETYVHAACGKPRPTVHTNLHQLPALVQPPARVVGVDTQLAALKALEAHEETLPPDPNPLGPAIQITPEQDAAFTELVQLGQEIQPSEPPTEQPKRRRGRPPKDTKGYVLERRDYPDRWCVIREESGEIVASGLTSKAKATECMDDLIRKATDGDSPANPVELPTAQPEPDACGSPIGAAEPAAEASSAADHLPAGAGQPVRPAAGGVRAAVAGSHPEDQAAGRPEDVDQGGAGPALPGPGGHGDQLEPHPAAAALPGGPDQGGPQGHREDLPGDLGPMHEDRNHLEAEQALTLDCDGQPVLHGPQGDCPECFRLWNWCPDSMNPARAQTSPDTSGQGSMPATVALTGSKPNRSVWTSSMAWRDPDCIECGGEGAPCCGPPDGPSPYPSTTPSTPVSNPVDNLPGSVIDSSRPSLAAFMSAAKHVAQSGNTPWAAQYVNELREVVRWHGDNTPRNLQVHLGPSEIGVACDRQVVGKLVGFPKTNHVVDPWPSIVGTAIHTWMDTTFQAENKRIGWERWLPERKVTPHPSHAGTSDLYDAQNFTVVDHKNLGESSMAKLRRPEGPPIHYQFQLKLYARGYRNLGLRVDRIAIVGWPRTSSSLDGAYVWEHLLTPADDQQLEQLFQRMEWRNQWAGAINNGLARLSDVPAMPDSEVCYHCPFYRPQSARDGGPGCPGHAGI